VSPSPIPYCDPTDPEPGTSLFQRRIITPLLDLLRVGCSPRKLAWSLAAGLVIGINPLLGSTTLVCLLLAFVLRLNLVASQIANHVVYPLQLALFLIFIRIGDKFFHTGRMPLSGHALFYGARHHPLATTRLLWTWEWHALIVWAIFSAIAAPAIALILTPMLHRLLHRLHKHPVPA
jgi:uncharacterized protein (DUF2062 family)